MDLAHYTTGLGCISKEKINAIQLPVPSLEKQQEIIDKYEIAMKQIENVKNSVDSYKSDINLINNNKKMLFM